MTRTILAAALAALLALPAAALEPAPGCTAVVTCPPRTGQVVTLGEPVTLSGGQSWRATFPNGSLTLYLPRCLRVTHCPAPAAAPQPPVRPVAGSACTPAAVSAIRAALAACGG